LEGNDPGVSAVLSRYDDGRQFGHQVSRPRFELDTSVTHA
jgi:hypothetical protein